MAWRLERTTRFISTFKKLSKKHGNECVNALDNVAKYSEALNEDARPAQISSLRFVHNEGEGVFAVDQSGRRRTNKQVRLYLYPDEVDHVLHVLLIGDKSSQKRDVNEVHEFVRGIRAQHEKREDDE